MLTTLPQDNILDLAPWVGQRSNTFWFMVVDGVSGEHKGRIYPLRSGQLSHDTSRTIKRQLTANLGAVDTATINVLVDRIDLLMVMGDGTIWPLGRYMFTNQTKVRFTSGDLSNVSLNDEMFLVDQEITSGFDSTGKIAVTCYEELLSGLPVELISEPAGFTLMQSWGIGTNRGSIMDAIATASDYFSPWFGNDKKMHLIRTFNPADQVPQFDWDAGNQVMRDSISEQSNVLTAPNRFMVISNTNTQNGAIVGIATVPPTAPNSFANRGFYISTTQTLQLSDAPQAQAVATGLANRLSVFETTTLSTALDPRHDSYDVIHWQGSLWLELAWSMQLQAGGKMTHTIRKGYGA